tara:strand:- start:908 stop:1096 length:189 start_codon:yes stop_codon:yes gene_type:complete
MTLPPKPLLKTWFDLMTKKTADNGKDAFAIREHAKTMIKETFGSTEKAMEYFVEQGWVTPRK